jgi:hypothetical protein
MTPDERAEHRQWHQSHAPGPPEPRAADRERRRQDREARAFAAAPRQPAPVTAEAAALASRISTLERELDARQLAAISANRFREGVFG